MLLLELIIAKVHTIAIPFSIFQLPFLIAFFEVHQLTCFLYSEHKLTLLQQQIFPKQFTFE